MAITGPASDPALINRKKKNTTITPRREATPAQVSSGGVMKEARLSGLGTPAPRMEASLITSGVNRAPAGPGGIPDAVKSGMTANAQSVLSSIASGLASGREAAPVAGWTPVAGTVARPAESSAASESYASSRNREKFRPSASTLRYQDLLEDMELDAPDAYVRPEFQESQDARDYYARMQALEGQEPGKFTYDPFDTSQRTKDYEARLAQVEGAEPGAYQSKYDGAIQSILDGILSKKKPYSIKDDINYNMLYDQAREQYMAAGQKAMRDSMGAAQAMTGGYGSTAAQAAGSQAYDSYLQGLNAQNPQLAELAYQMYRDQQGDQYNQLNAVQGLDESDYARWVQDYNNWLNNRGYYAGQAQQGYANDRNAYEADRNLDYNIWNQEYQNWANNRNYMADQYRSMYGRDWDRYGFETQMDAQAAQDAYNRWANDRAYLAGQAQQGYANDQANYQFDQNMDLNWDQFDEGRRQYDEQMGYARERDAISDYDDAFSKALQLAQNGMSIPASYANRLEPETLAMLQGLAGQALAAQASGGSGGSGGGGGRRGGRRGGSSKKGSGADDDLNKYNGTITVDDAKRIMRLADIQAGPEASRDLAQSLLNEGAVLTTTALAKPVALSLAQQQFDIEAGHGNVNPYDISRNKYYDEAKEWGRQQDLRERLAAGSRDAYYAGKKKATKKK